MPEDSIFNDLGDSANFKKASIIKMLAYPCNKVAQDGNAVLFLDSLDIVNQFSEIIRPKDRAWVFAEYGFNCALDAAWAFVHDTFYRIDAANTSNLFPIDA